MSAYDQFLNPSEAAKRIGVSAKTLRIYEQRGLITPLRSEAGWRAYGPSEMTRAAEIASLRRLGLSLAQVARVLDGDAAELDQILLAHHAALERQAADLTATMARVQHMRCDLAAGKASAAGDVLRLLEPMSRLGVAFDLPWPWGGPWGGERFELHDIAPLIFITGPLGSGKTRFARRLAKALPDADFLDMERLDDDVVPAQGAGNADADLKARVERMMTWLADEGATPSDALSVLIAALETDGAAVLVVDMLEHGLDAATQIALMSHLRRRRPDARKLIALTRSTAILDLSLVGRDEAIIYCPANHGPPMLVEPYQGTPGYEAVATCLASPEVRARTAGVVAWRPKAV